MKNKNSKKFMKKEQKKKQRKRQKALSKRADVLAEKKEKQKQFAIEDSRRRMREMMQPSTYKNSDTIVRQVSLAEQVFGSQDGEESAEEEVEQENDQDLERVDD